MTATAPTDLALAGTTCLVTGATRGIGESVALGLAALGVNVVAVGRDQARLDALAKSAAEADLSVLPVAADTTSEAEMDTAVASAVAHFGGLDSAFVNAGIAVVAPALEVSVEDFRSVVDTNLTGSFIAARAAAKAFTGTGSIVFTSSTFATAAETDWSSYCASKAGVDMLTKVLAGEWAAKGIRVNAIAPTATLTDQNRDLFLDPEFNTAITARIPVGRLLDREELTLPVAFLLSPRNAMLTGQTLAVDGGWTI